MKDLSALAETSEQGRRMAASSSASVPTSSMRKPPMSRRQTTKPRLEHRRRASQPASISLAVRAVDVTASCSSADESDHWTASSGAEDGNTSGSEDDDLWESRKVALDYLDLSPSLPFVLVSLRQQILAHCWQLEQRVRSLCRLRLPYDSEPTGNLDSQSADTFYAHLEGLKADLRRLASSLPTSTSSFSLPLITSQRASEALQAGRQSLVADWDRISSAVHVSLPSSPELHLPALPTFSLLADIDFSSIAGPLASQLPASGLLLLGKVQARFEALQDSVSAITLKDCFYSSQTAVTEKKSQQSQARRLSLSAPNQALAKQFETILETIKAKGEEVRQKGHASALSVAKAAWDTEERLYLAAVDLARGGQRLIRYEHLPTLWKNNEHILSGYRFIPANDIGALLRSTFEIHNETGNIMTHLIGALIVIPLFWPSKDQFDEQTTPMDRMVQSIYLIAALHCLVLSASWHVMAGCSDAQWFERFACVDYTGIAWLVAASVWTLVYNAFYCQPNLAMFYSLTTLLVGATGAIVPWAAWFNERKNKPIRIAVFLAMCFTGVGPFLHASLSHGFVKTSLFFSPILPSVGSYIFGLIFYATQFPERIAPGRFDVVGHAHQIWHVSIVVAILLHYRATSLWHEGRFDFSCAVNPLQQQSTSRSANALAHSASELASQVATSLFGENSALHKAADLNAADDIIHGWRISAGKLGDGMVGRIWDWGVERLMATF